MPQPNQETPYATTLQPTDVILCDQDTGAYDANGNKIYQTKGMLGSAFGSGNGAVALTPNSFLGNPASSGASNFGQPITFDGAQFQVDASSILRLQPSLADNLTAMGANQTTALQLTALINIFTTVPTNTGGKLLTLLLGQICEVWNLGANPLAMYPPPGGIINALGANMPVGIFPGNVLRFRCRSATSGATLWLAG